MSDSKTLSELKLELTERIDRIYGADFKNIPTGKMGAKGYRKDHARAVTFTLPPDPRGIRAAGVEDSATSTPSSNGGDEKAYTKYYKDYLKNIQNGRKNIQKNLDNMNKNKDVQESKKISSDQPPYMLMLKRVTTRAFPGSVNVALYHNDVLDRYFSVPYGKDIESVFQAENISEELSEKEIISSFLNIFKNLSEDQQEKMIGMINEGDESFSKVKKFILENGK